MGTGSCGKQLSFQSDLIYTTGVRTIRLSLPDQSFFLMTVSFLAVLLPGLGGTGYLPSKLFRTTSDVRHGGVALRPLITEASVLTQLNWRAKALLRSQGRAMYPPR